MKWKMMKLWSLFILVVLTLFLVACGSSGGNSSARQDVATAVSENSSSTNGDTAVIENTQPSPSVNSKLNINEASGDDFQAAIPDLGSRMVREFNEYRPYISIQQFRREIGKYVDDAQVATYEQYIYVPIDVDNADAETIMQIPGVDATIAQSLMDARPFNSNDAFLTKLTELAPAVDTAVAESYLAQ